jgi:hypothetical protein
MTRDTVGSDETDLNPLGSLRRLRDISPDQAITWRAWTAQAASTDLFDLR